VILATQEAEIRRIAVQGQPEKTVHEKTISKIPNTKKGWWSGSSSEERSEPDGKSLKDTGRSLASRLAMI
jgi:hypothetical protein